MAQHNSHFWTYDANADEHCRDCGCAWDAPEAAAICSMVNDRRGREPLLWSDVAYVSEADCLTNPNMTDADLADVRERDAVLAECVSVWATAPTIGDETRTFLGSYLSRAEAQSYAAWENVRSDDSFYYVER